MGQQVGSLLRGGDRRAKPHSVHARTAAPLRQPRFICGIALSECMPPSPPPHVVVQQLAGHVLVIDLQQGKQEVCVNRARAAVGPRLPMQAASWRKSSAGATTEGALTWSYERASERAAWGARVGRAGTRLQPAEGRPSRASSSARG